MTPSPTTANALTQLGKFLLAVLPSGVEVVQAQPNRIPEPKSTSFVVMTPIRQERLRTNIDTYADSKLVGSIAGNILTVTAVDPDLDGAIMVGSTIFGVDVLDGTRVQSLGTGTGGVGTYVLNNTQTVASRTLSAGAENIEQGVNQVVQLDFHSSTISSSDMATTVATLFCDAYAVDSFAAQSPNYGVVPLYTTDPRQMPFLNAEQQYEWRWVLECMIQSNAIVIVPQEFADSATIEPINVDAVYPP